MRSPFMRGISHGIPIMLGYLSVSFGLGIAAVRLGIPPLGTVLISLTNLTSAGQAAGIEIIAAGGTLIEMALTQTVINLRYALMGISLSQNLDDTFNTPRRMLVSFGITDEIYGVAISQAEPLTARYMYGLILMPVIGWTGGTALGALAGELLPAALSNAMGIVLYGMFLAIIIPPSRQDRRVLAVVLSAAVFSCLFKFALPMVSGGFAVIISALLSSLVGALVFPLREEELT